MEFEWDRTKAEQNLRKHGVAFEDAVDLFDDPRHLTQEGKIVDVWKIAARGKVR